MYIIEVIIKNGVTKIIECGTLEVAKKVFEEIVDGMKDQGLFYSCSEKEGICIRLNDISWVSYKEQLSITPPTR